MAHVRYLADDLLEGRLIGLEPAGHDGSWFHTFPVRTGGALGSDNSMSLAAEPLVLHADWAPYGFFASGCSRRSRVGGYGVSRPGQARTPLTRPPTSTPPAASPR